MGEFVVWIADLDVDMGEDCDLGEGGGL